MKFVLYLEGVRNGVHVDIARLDPWKIPREQFPFVSHSVAIHVSL